MPRSSDRNIEPTYVQSLEQELLRAREELAKYHTHPRLGLVWEDQPEDVERFLRSKIPVLQSKPTKAIGDGSGRPHILIEGDNLHALTCLQYTHEERVDVIYIDPPYNTGVKKFRYNDSFVQRSDEWGHSKWLSFMYKRLRLAWTLLTPSGVVYISVDDREQAQLKLLCDQIFGAKCYHGMVTWVKKSTPVNIGKAKHNLQPKLEYVLVYTKCKKSSYAGFNTDGGAVKGFPHIDSSGHACRYEGIVNGGKGVGRRDTLRFPILGVVPPSGKQWKLGADLVEDLLSQQPPRIRLVEGMPKKVVYPSDYGSTKSTKPFWSHLENTGTAADGKKLLGQLVGDDHDFDTVKPLGLIKELVSRVPGLDLVVLDFFAGSGTTAHAVAELNSEDGGTRQSILITNNEKEEGYICETLTYPRIQAALTGRWEDGEQHSSLPGGLLYYKCEFVAVSKSDDALAGRIAKRAADMVSVREEMYYPVAVTGEHCRILTDAHKAVVVWGEWASEGLKDVLSSYEGFESKTLYTLSLETPPIIQEELPQWRVESLPGGMQTLLSRSNRIN